MPHTFPQFLGDAEKALKRFAVAKARKEPWIDHLQECYHYALPQRETFYYHYEGERKNLEIFDSTALNAVQRFAARIQATMAPPWRKWARLVPGPEVPEEQADNPRVREQLEELTSVLFAHLNRSNFASQSHEAFLDLSVGTGAMCLQRGEGDSLLEFNAVPSAQLYLEEGPMGRVETVWRAHKVDARNVERMWQGAEASADVKRAAMEKPDKEISIIEGVIYDPQGRLYHGIAIEQATKHLVWTEQYEVSPWVVFRWMTVPGEIYGRGPVMSALPDIKTTNKVTEFLLRNAALNVSGMYTSTDDSILNPYSMRVAPGVVIPVLSNDTSNPTLRALERSGDAGLAQFVLDDLQTKIKVALYNDLRRPEGPVRSATEIAIEDRELIQDIGSSFGRLQTEFVESVVRRAIAILRDDGLFPDIRVDGREIEIQPMSPLARAQDQEELLAFQRGIEAMSILGPELVRLGVKVEDVPEWIGRKVGMDQDLLRSEDERNDITEKAAEAVAAQAEADPAAGTEAMRVVAGR